MKRKKSKAEKKLCQQCGNRKALHRSVFWRNHNGSTVMIWKSDHDLCDACYRNLCNSIRGGSLP